MRILYIAYAASPYGGSEEALGWSLPLAMSRIEGNEVHLITKVEQREAVEDYLAKHPETRLTVSFCDIPSFYKNGFSKGVTCILAVMASGSSGSHRWSKN